MLSENPLSIKIAKAILGHPSVHANASLEYPNKDETDFSKRPASSQARVNAIARLLDQIL